MAFPLALIPVIVSALSTVYGGVDSAKQRKKQQQLMNDQLAENQDFYNRNYYGSYLDRPDAQAVLRGFQDTLKRDGKAAESRAAITGATPEVAAARKEVANRSLADLYSNLGAQGAQYKDMIRQQYTNAKAGLVNGQVGFYGQSAQQGANLMTNGMKGFGSAIDQLAKYDWGNK
jgi:hypothetical protein